MNVSIIMQDAGAESVTLGRHELESLKEALNDPEIQFLWFKQTANEIMINKDHIIKIWWIV